LIFFSSRLQGSLAGGIFMYDDGNATGFRRDYALERLAKEAVEKRLPEKWFKGATGGYMRG